MATVYRARDRRLGREVAVKVIHHHLRENTEVAARFVSEARAVAKVKHPNIVEVYDVSDADEPERYLVQELVRGTTLRQLIAAARPLAGRGRRGDRRRDRLGAGARPRLGRDSPRHEAGERARRNADRRSVGRRSRARRARQNHRFRDRQVARRAGRHVDRVRCSVRPRTWRPSKSRAGT